MAKIVIDPGHGGKDPGAVNTRNPATDSDDLYEKNLTLQMAFTLKSALEAKGHAVLLTRSSDIYVGNTSKVLFANNAKADLFIALHFNASTDKSAAGFEVYHDNASVKGKSWGDLTAAAFSKAFPGRKVRGVFPDNLSQHSDLTVLSKTAMPAILVEAGFISNDEEVDWCLRSLRQMCDAIALASDQFLAQIKSKGLTVPPQTIPAKVTVA